MDQFQTVAKVGDIPPGEGRAFPVDGTVVAVFNVDGEYTAINDVCPHMGASLAEGYLLDRDLVAARSAAEQAIRVAVVQHDAGARIQALLVLAECQRLEAGDDVDAGAGLRAEALAIAERLHLRPMEVRCRRRLAIIA